MDEILLTFFKCTDLVEWKIWYFDFVPEGSVILQHQMASPGHNESKKFDAYFFQLVTIFSDNCIQSDTLNWKNLNDLQFWIEYNVWYTLDQHSNLIQPYSLGHICIKLNYKVIIQI